MRSRPAGAGPRARARRRDSTYLPGFRSGSAGRGAAGALPPSFLLPPPPPRSATHNTRRKRKPRREARVSGSRGVGWPPREGLAVPAGGGEGGGPEVRTSWRSQEREGTRSGRCLKFGRPGDWRNPLEKEGRACAWLSAEAPLPAGRRWAPGTVAVPPGSGAGFGHARWSRVGLEAAEGTARAVADFELHLSSLQASPERRWRAEAAASYVADLRVSTGTSLPTG